MNEGLELIAPPTRREEVFALLDDERGYQLRRWGVMGEDLQLHEVDCSVGDYIVYMQHHLTKAIEALSVNTDSLSAMSEIRKVTALGVAAMENFETPERSKTVQNKRDNLHYDENFVPGSFGG